jgi:hypothetical protein
MSYNKTTERRPDDAVEMSTYTVEPSKEYVIDSRNLSHIPETNHVSRFDSATMANSDNEKKTSSASVSVRNPESEFAAGQKQQSPSWPLISGSVPVNENHTESHSTRSSVTPPDYAFLRVSDVDAHAQPIKLQPSSKHQPNLLDKDSAAKEDVNPVNQFIPTSVHSTLRNSIPQADKKADADPISASAAMKEPMDFAEARLKAAKELLERKGDSFKLRKKPSHHRSTRYTEIKTPVPVELDTSKQKLSVKKPPKEEKSVEDSLSDKHKKSSASRLNQPDEGVIPLEKPQQMMQHRPESCQTFSNIEKLGNWRSGDEFYELTGDEQKFQTIKATGKDDNSSVNTNLSNDMKGENVFSATDPDLERYEKLWKVNDGMDAGVKHANLREDNTAAVSKESVIVETSTENMAHQEICSSKLEELVTQENAKESHDDDCVELPSMIGTSTKLDSTEDMSGLLSESYSSGNHASVLRDLGNSNPNLCPVSRTSQEHTL